MQLQLIGRRRLLGGAITLGGAAALAACTATQATQGTTAIGAAAAVLTDLVQLAQQAETAGLNLTAAELQLLDQAIEAAGSGVAELVSNPTAVQDVVSKITTALNLIAPFIPGVAQIIVTLSGQAAPTATPVPAASAPILPAVHALAVDLPRLKSSR